MDPAVFTAAHRSAYGAPSREIWPALGPSIPVSAAPEIKLTRRIPLVLFVLVYAAAFRLVTLNRPFNYDDESTGGSFYGIMARNYLRFPWTETHGMPVVTVGRLSHGPLVFYADHPPLVPLLIAPVYRLYGVGAWQTRLPTAIATVLAIYVLYLLLIRFGTARAALMSAALFAATPMALIFGGQSEVLGMPLVLFALLTVMAYLRFHRAPTRAALAGLMGAFTLAAFTDWPAFILAPLLTTHFGLTRPRRQWPWMLTWSAYVCALFGLLYLYIMWAAALPWSWMLPLLKGRTAIGVNAPFTAREWLQTTWTFNLHLHTAPLLAATCLWLLSRLARPRVPQAGTRAAMLLLAWGTLHVLIGRQGVFNHEWWWWPLTPGIAVASGLLVDGMLVGLERRRRSWAPQAIAAIAVILFAVWTTHESYGQLSGSHQEDAFTTMDLGRAIQVAAPEPNDLAMLAWSGFDPELWFYGDRPLRADIWTVNDFTARRSGEYADLVFGALQPWPAPATGLVFPTEGRRTLPVLHAYLVARYPRVPLPEALVNKVEVFDLRPASRRN